MPRRTKEEALQTRHALIDAAERVFEERGVGASSLQQVAQAAGLTRGAVYWHFEDKSALFNAMMDRAILPFEQAWFDDDPAAGQDPLLHLQRLLVDILRQTARDDRLQRTLRIATQQTEYGGDLSAVRERRLAVRRRALRRIERLLVMARRHGSLDPRVRPAATAHALNALVDGLIGNWLLDRSTFDLQRTGREAIERMIDALRAAADTRSLV